MKNLVFLILIAFSFVGNSQVKVNFGSINGNVGDTVSVTVNIDNFTKISSFQYSVTYDSLVLQYVGWGDRHSTISNVSVQDFDSLQSLGIMMQVNPIQSLLMNPYSHLNLN